MRVLIVDDNQDAALILSILLVNYQHEVRTAHDGEEALIAASEFSREAILLDIGLPKKNGYEVARQLRAQPGQAKVRIVTFRGFQADGLTKAEF